MNRRTNEPDRRKEARRRRLDAANQVLTIVGSHGARLFYSETQEAMSRLHVDMYGQIWFVDGHSGMKVYPYGAGRWIGFTAGEAMRSLVEALRHYLETGEPVSAAHFGPWPDGHGWGYPDEAMEAVRQAVYQVPAVRAPQAIQEEPHAQENLFVSRV